MDRSLNNLCIYLEPNFINDAMNKRNLENRLMN